MGATVLPDPQVEPWPAAARLALVFTSCGLFWTVVGTAVVHAFAR